MRSAMTRLIARAMRHGLRAQYAAQAHEFIQNPLRRFAFRHSRQRQIAAVSCEERHHICIEVKTRAFRCYVIGYDQVGILCRQFLPRVFRDVLGLGGESDHQPIAFDFRDIRENVLRRLELYREDRLSTGR